MHRKSIPPSTQSTKIPVAVAGQGTATPQKSRLSDEEEKVDRIKRYASAEFTRELLQQMYEAKEAALLALQEQREK
jgi:hypothetical protein